MLQPTKTPMNAIAGYMLDGAMRSLDGFKKGAYATVNDPPPVTPYRVVFESGKVRLRHYAAAGKHAHRTPIVLVYALIKRPFVLDMQKGRSVNREHRPAAAHRREHVGLGHRSPAGQQHHHRARPGQPGGHADQQGRLAAPLAAVGQHEVGVLRVQRHAVIPAAPRVADQVFRGHAQQHRHGLPQAGPGRADDSHDAGGGPAVNHGRARQPGGGRDRGPEHLLGPVQMGPFEGVRAAADDQHRAPGFVRLEAQGGHQLAGFAAVVPADQRAVTVAEPDLFRIARYRPLGGIHTKIMPLSGRAPGSAGALRRPGGRACTRHPAPRPPRGHQLLQTRRADPASVQSRML